MTENLGGESNKPLQCDNSSTTTANIVNKNPDFWTKFMEIIQTSPEAISEVLDIDEQHIRAWQSKIHCAMERARQITTEKQRATMISTG